MSAHRTAGPPGEPRVGIALDCSLRPGRDPELWLDEHRASLTAARSAGWDWVLLSARGQLPPQLVRGTAALADGMRLAHPWCGGRAAGAGCGCDEAAPQARAVVGPPGQEPCGCRPGPAVSRWYPADSDRAARAAARRDGALLVGAEAPLPVAAARLHTYRALRAEHGLPPAREVPLVRDVAEGQGGPDQCLHEFREAVRLTRATELILRFRTPVPGIPGAVRELNAQVLPYL